eukprot:356026-Chlamydomonas_euryale.AAC.3
MARQGVAGTGLCAMAGHPVWKKKNRKWNGNNVTPLERKNACHLTKMDPMPVEQQRQQSSRRLAWHLQMHFQSSEPGLTSCGTT